jgi:photosystem II stability/assembly factor-like uncharacterized protein
MSHKLYYILILVGFLTTASYAQGTWEKIKTPTDFDLLKVYYLDSLHCWVAGDSGVIMFSSDQGSNWQVQNSGVTNYISDLFFLNDTLGWAVAFEIEEPNSDIRSKILKTTDGGLSWTKNNYRHLNVILTTIFFLDSVNGWIGAKPSGISYTTDGGTEWFEANIDTGSFANFPIHEIKFITPQYGFAVGGAVDVAGVVWRTSNSGNLWKAYGIAPDKFDDFIFLDSTNVLSLSADLEKLYPIGVLDFNFKQNFWEYTELTKYGRVSTLARRNSNEIWCTLGCDTAFIVSFDNADTWEFVSTNDSLCINALAFADSLHGIAIGEGGYVYKFIPDSIVSVEENGYQTINSFSLEQNYPNPFNPSTKILYSISDRQFVLLKIYDLLGREVATLVNEEKSAGKYEVEFNVAQESFHAIASGIYFYQLKTENNITSKKMILLK